MKKHVIYRFESFLYPANVTRIEVEKGSADWRYIRRRHIQLADERKEQVMLYVYNDALHRWDYCGKALPGGDWYDFQGDGPYQLNETADRYITKGDDK